MSFTELLGNVGFFGAAVMLCLVALSIFSVALIVDKHRRFRAASVIHKAAIQTSIASVARPACANGTTLPAPSANSVGRAK